MRLLLIAILCLLSFSCRSEKGALEFNPDRRRGLNTFKVDIEPTYASLKVVLIERSCLKCHNPDSDEVHQAPHIPLDNYEDLVGEAENVLFTLSEECEEEDLCMPERSENGKPKAPIPTAEVIQAFQDWMAADFPE